MHRHQLSFSGPNLGHTVETSVSTAQAQMDPPGTPKERNVEAGVATLFEPDST